MMTRVRDRVPAGGIRMVLPIDLRPLLGGWVNYDETSTGINRVYIDDWEGTPTVRVFGASRPTPIDWGEVAGAAFADGVGGHQAVGFTASYDLDFAQVLLAGYLNKRLLVLDAYSMVTDGRGRANYFQ